MKKKSMRGNQENKMTNLRTWKQLTGLYIAISFYLFLWDWIQTGGKKQEITCFY